MAFVGNKGIKPMKMLTKSAQFKIYVNQSEIN